MRIEEYIELLESYQSDLESDITDIENMISELEEVTEAIGDADGLDELKDAIEILENLDHEPNDLVVPDTKQLHDNFDTDSWIQDYKSSVQVVVSAPEKEEKK